MCEFFSFLSNGRGQYYYFNWDQRKSLLKSNPENYNADSHSSIAHFHSKNEDELNKYEYNPLTNQFTVDQINSKRNDSSVRDSVGDSVGDSVWAYYSSFFKIKYSFDFSSSIKLWNRGFVPYFDGKTWRLHQGKDAKIVYEMEAK